MNQHRPKKFVLMTLLLMLALAVSLPVQAAVTLVAKGKPHAVIVTNVQGAQGSNAQIILDAAQTLASNVEHATGSPSTILAADAGKASEGNAIILALASQYPDQVKAAGFDSKHPDAFAIVTKGDRTYILGNSAFGVSHGVSTLLLELGFHRYAPSPKWWIAPKNQTIEVDINLTSQPTLRGRGIWYAYGVGGDKTMGENYKTWAVANRLPSAAPFHTGHAYGNIISRNKAEFEAHPEYFALLENGERDAKRGYNARKFCVTNQGLIDLVIKDRIKLLEEKRANNPYEFMVSVDPSDGQGSCLCENCAKIGTTTDRVVHLTNQVAKALRAKYPDAWAGMYAYSSHRRPPTIDVEPNVYVQVAMGFNRTEYTLPGLVSAWADKVNALGIREYYGVEAWDWGLPGRMRGGQVAYHKKWIPYYAQRKLNAINGETNANWGGQTLGLYVASRLMWNPEADVDSITDEYFKLAFGKAAGTMKNFDAKMDKAPILQPDAILPMFYDLSKAYEETKSDKAAQARIVDLMAYMHYIALYRKFNLAEIESPDHGDKFYDALGPLMEFAWRIRDRDMVHYYALARRLCNGLPLSDNRFEYWYALTKEKRIPARRLKDSGVNVDDLPDHPVWKVGEAYSDDEIVALFKKDIAELQKDDNPLVFFTRYFDFGEAAGPDAGHTKLKGQKANSGTAEVRFKNSVTLYYAPGTITEFPLDLKAANGPVKVTAYRRGSDIMLEQAVKAGKDFVTLQIPMPRPGEYRVVIEGDVTLRSGPNIPLLYEASPGVPATLDESGPLYFYVPRGVSELMFDTTGHVTFQIPGQSKPVTFRPGDRAKGKSYITVPVDEKAAGKMWHVTEDSAGQFSIINAPPLLSAYREMVIVPREVSMADGVTTGGPADE